MEISNDFAMLDTTLNLGVLEQIFTKKHSYIPFMMWLIGLSETNNKINYTQADLIKLNVFSKTTLKKHMKTLIDNNILILDNMLGNNKYYRINNDLMWKGSDEDWCPEAEEYQLKL